MNLNQDDKNYEDVSPRQIEETHSEHSNFLILIFNLFGICPLETI